jgi:hypothetical protein
MIGGGHHIVIAASRDHRVAARAAPRQKRRLTHGQMTPGAQCV